MTQPLVLFYDADKAETVFGRFINDGKSDIVIDQDVLDLLRWDTESPNVEPNPYENLRAVSYGDKIWLKSGRVIQKKHKRKIKWNTPMSIELVKDDGIRQRFRAKKDIF